MYQTGSFSFLDVNQISYVQSYITQKALQTFKYLSRVGVVLYNLDTKCDADLNQMLQLSPGEAVGNEKDWTWGIGTEDSEAITSQ